MLSGERFYGHRRQRLFFLGHNDKRYAWKNKGEALKPKNTVSDVNHGGSIMLWGFFAVSGTGMLYKLDGKKEGYFQINS